MSTLYSIPNFTNTGSFDPASIAAAGTTFFQELDPYRLYLKHDEWNLPDWKTASRFIWCPEGKVVVEMLQAPEKIGALYIPERMRETYHNDLGDPIAGVEPSVGIVLAAGAGVDLDPGMKVLVIDGDGVSFGEFSSANYEAKGEVRMFGLVVPEPTEHWHPPYEGYCEWLPWEQSIVGVLESGMKVIPSGRNILVKKDPFQTQTESGIYVPDVGQERTSIATVMRCGPDCIDIREGHRIVYHPLCELSFVDSDDDDLRMIREETVLCVLLGESESGESAVGENAA